MTIILPDSPAQSLPPGPAGVCTAAKVRRLSRQVSQIYDDALSRHGLTIGQFGLLASLSRRRGLAIGALAERLAADASTISRLVRPLADEGLLRIEIDPKDKRGRLVWLTDAGHQRRAAAHAGWQAAQAVVEQRLGAGRLAALRFLLDDTYERLEAAE
ncbi:MarR family winged helix-turn-helix transcriptional regulator [Sandarakinorhabdus oryzae]|uniref:MarR family winged helix-turn-helix transcriptional regulator n=1 Tax=Sandarakinorhabdus oryzae TaxID=2675220 RepID=UPI0012E31F0D|nr:MarR family transcriptional regulator [Sandarakinorhabdus oryzae]